MELGQPQFVGVLHDKGVHIGQVDARLDDGGAHQHVQLPVGHLGHHVVDGLLAHAPVGHANGGVLPQQHLDAGGAAVDGLHPVVEVEHLPAPLQLPAHGVGQEAPVVLQHIGLHRLAVGGGLLQGGHVPDAAEGHVQRPGDRGGRQSEHVHLLEGLLQLLLVLHPEALLLVHHEKPQVLEAHILVEQPVGADEDVHLPVFHLAQGLLHLGGGAEAGHHIDVHRVLGEPAQGGEVVLPGQDGSGHQNGGLLVVQHALHHGPEGHLRLAVAHVAAQQPVHGGGALHVPLDLPDAAKLVVGLSILELFLKLPLPGGVGGKGVARLALALGIEPDQPFSQVLYRLFGLGLGFFPLAAPQAVELSGLVGVLAAADVLAHQVQLGGGDVEHVAAGVGDLHIVLLNALHRHFYHAHIPAHPVVLVDHQVAGGEVGVGLQLLPVGGVPPGAGLPGGGFLSLCEDGQLDGGVLKAAGQPPHGDDHLAGLGKLLELEVHGGFDLLLPEEGLQVDGPLLSGHQHQGGESAVLVVGQVLDRRLQAGQEGGKLLGGDGQQLPGRRGVGGGGKGVQIDQGEVLQFAEELGKGEGQPGTGGVQLPLLQQSFGVLLQLPLVALGPVGNPGRLIENHAGVGGEVVGGAGLLRVDQGEVAVQGGEGAPLGDGLAVLLQSGGQLPVPVLEGLGRQFFHFFAQTSEAAGRELRKDLGGGEEEGGLDVFRPALGGGVKDPHGVHLIPEEFRPDRAVHAGRKYVQNPAPKGELANPLHLLAPDVPGGGQGFGQLVQLEAAAQLQFQAAPFQQRPGHGPLEQSFHGGHQEGVFPAGQPLYQGQPPVLPLAGEGGGVVEGEVPGTQHGDARPDESPQVSGQLLPLALVGAHHHHRPAGGQANAGGDVTAVNGSRTGQGRGGAASFQRGQELLKFGQAVQGASEQLHGKHLEIWKMVLNAATPLPPGRGRGVSVSYGKGKGQVIS